MRYHAYISKDVEYPLSDHLIHTYIVVEKTMLKKRLEVLAVRIASNRDASIINKLLPILQLPVILHDIGKILPVYQIRPRGWRHGYKYHEVVGAIIVNKLFDTIEDRLEEVSDSVEELPYGYLKTLIAAPILLHHYALREVQQREVEIFFKREIPGREYSIVSSKDATTLLREVIEHSRYSEYLNHELANLLKEIIRPCNSISNIVINTSSINDIFSKIFRVYGVHGRKTSYSIEMYVSALTGIVSIADYIAGSLVRSKECRLTGYPVKILASKELDIVEKIICTR